MRPRDSSTDDLWSVVSLDDFSDELLTIAGVHDDEDDDLTSTAADCSDEQKDVLSPEQLTTTSTARVKSSKTKSTRSVVRRNERERNRVKQVNQGFDRLRQYVRLPGLSKKKLSKVDTLRAAVVYIKQLQSLLDEANAAAAFRVNEQLLSSPHQPQLYQQQLQQQQPDAVTSPSSDFVLLSLLQTNISSPTESYEAAPSTSGILRTSSTPLCTAYSTGSAWLPLVDINDNNYVIAESASQCPEPCLEPCPSWLPDVVVESSSQCPEPFPSWSPDADGVNAQNVSEQQRRLSELTAWLME